jgi:hypothetical protein
MLFRRHPICLPSKTSSAAVFPTKGTPATRPGADDGGTFRNRHARRDTVPTRSLQTIWKSRASAVAIFRQRNHLVARAIDHVNGHHNRRLWFQRCSHSFPLYVLSYRRA